MANSGTTVNSPQTDDIKKAKDELKSKINNLQGVGLPGVKDVPKTLWENLIKPNLLSPRQVSKKFLLLQGQSYPTPLSEEDAQLIIYGKIYYKDGKLYDNDIIDPACVSQPSDEDYQPPIDENHPLWQKVLDMIKNLEEYLLQLGIKLGEFLFALPNALAVITISLAALVSSATILPFGAGLPTALGAIQTMFATIKNLQSKTADILPLLVIVDTIGLLLPKESQSAISQINAIFILFTGIVTGLTAILGLLGGVSNSIEKSKTKMNKIPLTIAPKAEPANITKGQDVKLTANASGSDYLFTYEWTDSNGNIVSRDINSTDDDDGTRLVTPDIPVIIDKLNKISASTIYTCKVKDGKGSIKQSDVTITRI